MTLERGQGHKVYPFHLGDLDLGTAPLVKAGATTAVSGRLPAIR